MHARAGREAIIDIAVKSQHRLLGILRRKWQRPVVGIENLTTGSGNDVVYASDAANTLDGGAGNDTARYDYTGQDAAITFNLLATSAGTATATAKVTSLPLDTLYNFEVLIGAGQNDTFYGTQSGYTLNGQGGDADRVDYSAQADAVNTRSPNQLVATAFATAKYSGDTAAASSHHTASIVPTISPLPVIRVRIDVIEVSCGR